MYIIVFSVHGCAFVYVNVHVSNVQTADKAVAASPPMMMNPKSYAVTAAPPQPAAVPKPKLSTAPSMMSTDLKPSVASKLAVNTTSLKVKLPCGDR